MNIPKKQKKKLTLFSFYCRNQDIDCVIHENVFVQCSMWFQNIEDFQQDPPAS